ncbi:MerR family transcriptional regulator [Kitasatospora sp. NPDC059747]|uniref:MerR family transcriptional regulator n=1 Tax=Kitasatospora sp. NPDC059747 TaxID=3346930 RepID=UPI003666FA6F
MLTIGQLADYAGVTAKAVRHYHERGLLAEPDRDSSGYRRYDAQQALTLVKIRTLAGAGVPLARVKDLLDGDPDTLATAIAEIDQDLRDRIAHLRQARANLARLRSGDRLFVSPDVADYLDHLRELGVSERQVRLERDGWILLHAASPEDADRWFAQKQELITDDAIFGSPYPVFNADHIWNEVNPADPANLARLANTDVTLYTGNNDTIEHFTEIAANNVKSRLDRLGIPSRYVDYGNGASLSPTCAGTHSYTCFAPAVADYIPHLKAAFAAAG